MKGDGTMSKKIRIILAISCTLLVLAVISADWAAGAPKEAKVKLTLAANSLGSEVWWPPYTAAEANISQSVGDGLVRILSPFNVEPLMATEWKVSPDGKRWEFTMREDAYFTDGVKVKPEDMQYTLEQRKKYMGYSGLKQHILNIETDGNRVIINLKSPVPQMLDNYLSWLAVRPKHILEKIGDEEFNKHPVGAGPFKFVKHVKREYVTLEKNENYYGKKATVDEVTFRVVPEPSTRIAMLRAGEADISYSEIGPNTAELTRYGLRAVRFGWPCQELIFFNRLKKYDQPPSKFADKRVREAMLYALDREALAKALYHGMADAAGSVTIVGKALGSPPYNNQYDTYPYDPDKAKKLLAEAGHSKGFDMELRAYPANKELATVISSYLGQVGINVNIKIWEIATYVSAYYKHTSQEDFAYLALGYATGPACFVYIDPKSMVCQYASKETALRQVGDAVIGTENQRKWMHDVLIPALYNAQGILPLIEHPVGVIGLGPRIKHWSKMDGHSLGLEFVELHQ